MLNAIICVDQGLRSTILVYLVLPGPALILDLSNIKAEDPSFDRSIQTNGLVVKSSMVSGLESSRVTEACVRGC